MDSQTCATCAFWNRDHGLDCCHAGAPAAWIQDGILETHWPPTNHDDWCGQHQLAVGAEAADPLRDDLLAAIREAEINVTSILANRRPKVAS